MDEFEIDLLEIGQKIVQMLEYLATQNPLSVKQLETQEAFLHIMPMFREHYTAEELLGK